jgi:chromosome partitioning protein
VARVMAVVNQKGGVGKTTTCVNLAYSLGLLGKKTLLCDFDPQANATSGYGVDKNALRSSVYDVLINGADPAATVVKTTYGDILPSNKSLAGAGVEMVGIPDREHLLKSAIDRLKDRYDAVLIDCPPSLELLTVNGLCAADGIIVPVQCEYYALEGLSDLMATVRIIKRSLNPNIVLDALILTMYDGRTVLSLQVAEEVKRHFGAKVCPVIIPRNVRLSEAPSHGKPALALDKFARGAKAYMELAEYFVGNIL